jgi:hypothetical protein
MPKNTPALERLAHTPKNEIPFAVTYHQLADFVFFSHARHSKARVACSECHDDAYAADVPKPNPPLKMKSCVDCHKTRKATTACDKCHELGQ